MHLSCSLFDFESPHLKNVSYASPPDPWNRFVVSGSCCSGVADWCQWSSIKNELFLGRFQTSATQVGGGWTRVVVQAICSTAPCHQPLGPVLYSGFKPQSPVKYLYDKFVFPDMDIVLKANGSIMCQ